MARKPERQQIRTRSSIPAVREEIDALRDRIALLEHKVAEFETASQHKGSIVVLRTISRDEAKQEILEMFQEGKTLFYSDIAQKLRVELPLVVELCQELEKEGEIEVDADALRQG